MFKAQELKLCINEKDGAPGKKGLSPFQIISKSSKKNFISSNKFLTLLQEMKTGKRNGRTSKRSAAPDPVSAAAVLDAAAAFRNGLLKTRSELSAQDNERHVWG